MTDNMMTSRLAVQQTHAAQPHAIDAGATDFVTPEKVTDNAKPPAATLNTTSSKCSHPLTSEVGNKCPKRRECGPLFRGKHQSMRSGLIFKECQPASRRRLPGERSLHRSFARDLRTPRIDMDRTCP